MADLPWPGKALGSAPAGRVGAMPKGAALRLLRGLLRHEPRGVVRQPLQLELIHAQLIPRAQVVCRSDDDPPLIRRVEDHNKNSWSG